MRKFFYSISVFVFLCVLSLGYYGTYKAADAQRRNSRTEEIQDYQEAKLENTAENGDGDIIKKTGTQEIISSQPETSEAASAQEGGYGLYYLKEKDGCVAVYESDKTTLFEPTNIPVSMLPDTLKQEICRGKYLKSQAELYSFLENYSS
ncbi:MAG: hypothetical protein Q4D16_20030 [Eubacteriales bacterium]|nr:hypothetical protein [Eubacteriales bacterium]